MPPENDDGSHVPLTNDFILGERRARKIKNGLSSKSKK
jgi:hypothetical protein